MNNLIIVANFSIATAGLMITLFGIVMTLASKYADKGTRRFLLVFFAVLALYLTLSLLSGIAEYLTTDRLFTQATIYLESLFSSLLLPMLTLYMIIRSNGTARSTEVYIVDMLWIGYFALLTHTQTTSSIYYISADNAYHRGPMYPLLLVLPALIMLVNLIALIRRRSKLSGREFTAFLAYIIIPSLAIFVQMRVYGIHFIELGTVIAAGIMLILLLTGQAEQAARQKEELAKQEASLMVLQMRPHFIYNTMMSIYYLVVQDPEKAQSVILDFSTYLRKNFTALAKPDMIPFTEELEHAKAYLAVEQVRFEDKLFVKYDTPYTDFVMPSLTLQPLVENCVKHGVDPELDPLTIYVRTEKTGRGYDVIVADTGPGFGNSESTAGNRVAFKNIEERLDMCGGGVSVDSCEGEGTVVTLHIPANAQTATADA